ncbi:hypothetical protein [Legionella sp. W05-934-2]|uniref:hypothetical protein n=1 Tax=Legionella sp. W05-934-2 TaxID=1198649 RepID=UPI0034619C82
MNKLIGLAAGATLALSSSAFAFTPMYLTTHNNTSVESNAWVNGQPSPYPTKPNSTKQVVWGLVQLACAPIIVNGTCSADVKMETNTAHPVTLGRLTMDLRSGVITPAVVAANGYRLTVNGPGEVTLTKD